MTTTLQSQAAAGDQGAHWGYTGEVGPAQWGDLAPSYAICKLGQQQSPVDIADPISAPGVPIDFRYSASPLQVVNNGHTIQVNDSSASFIQIADQSYKLLQFHFHSPSENTVEGQPYAMELHLVHRDEQEHLAVVGVFVRGGAHNTALQMIWDHMPETANQTNDMPQLSTTPAALLPSDGSYYHFEGSLTTPPCTEGVAWYVLQTPIEASIEQIQRFVSVIGENARPVQPLNERTVQAVQADSLISAPC